MTTIRQVYKEALSPAYGLEEMTVRMLLQTVNHFSSMTELLSKMDEPMKGLEEYQRLFARVLSGEPIQYVLKKAAFYGIDLFVDRRVLIPRPETEELVDRIIHDFKKKTYPKVIVDIGTGSGCIAFALEKHFGESHILAVDSSTEALEVANINKQQLSSNVEFLQGDLLTPLIHQGVRVDILVSNPPYIQNREEVEANVLNYEPHSALFAPNGIDHYRSMISKAFLVMNDGGTMCFEINYDQEEPLKKILEEFLPNSSYQFLKDMQGKTRFLFVTYLKDSRSTL
mgnify:CR=1 FL=1